MAELARWNERGGRRCAGFLLLARLRRLGSSALAYHCALLLPALESCAASIHSSCANKLWLPRSQFDPGFDEQQQQPYGGPPEEYVDPNYPPGPPQPQHGYDQPHGGYGPPPPGMGGPPMGYPPDYWGPPGPGFGGPPPPFGYGRGGMMMRGGRGGMMMGRPPPMMMGPPGVYEREGPRIHVEERLALDLVICRRGYLLT